MKFRQHRGGLADSMETVVELKDRDELLRYAKALLEQWPTAPPVSDETLHVRWYAWDARIGWDTHIVTLDGYGVLGFTDGAVDRGVAGVAGTD